MSPFPSPWSAASRRNAYICASFNNQNSTTMAKGNLFLGMGRGSVGDVTFYRSNGQQVSRARNRRPSNPKSDAQIYQRAISATISQAYKAGKAIFDHAFEGRRVPSGNQQRFLSVNMRKLRAAIMADLATANTPEQCAGVVVSPRSTAPVAFAYRISEGSLIQSLFDYVLDSEGSDQYWPMCQDEGRQRRRDHCAVLFPSQRSPWRNLYNSRHGCSPGIRRQRPY